MSKVIQIIPAVGWRLAYWDTDAHKVFHNEIIAFGLTDDGNVIPVGWSENESDDTPMSARNFLGLCPPNQRMPIGVENYERWVYEVRAKYDHS